MVAVTKRDGRETTGLQTAATVYMFADGVDFVAALLAIWVVRTITACQVGAVAASPRAQAPEALTTTS